MDSPCRQRSNSLCQPHSTSPHPSRAGVPTRLPDALGYRPSTAGGQGATLSTFPLVPLTCELTCTQAIDPGISRSTLTPVDTSRPSRNSGHFPDFPWRGSPWLAHGSPLHGDWFPNPTGLLLGGLQVLHGVLLDLGPGPLRDPGHMAAEDRLEAGEVHRAIVIQFPPEGANREHHAVGLGEERLGVGDPHVPEA